MSIFWSIVLTILGVLVLLYGIGGKAPDFTKWLPEDGWIWHPKSMRICSRILLVLWRVFWTVSGVSILLWWVKVPDPWSLILLCGVFSPLLIFVLVIAGYLIVAAVWLTLHIVNRSLWLLVKILEGLVFGIGYLVIDCILKPIDDKLAKTPWGAKIRKSCQERSHRRFERQWERDTRRIAKREAREKKREAKKEKKEKERGQKRGYRKS